MLWINIIMIGAGVLSTTLLWTTDVNKVGTVSTGNRMEFVGLLMAAITIILFFQTVIADWSFLDASSNF